MRFASFPTGVIPLTTLVLPTISCYINTLRPRRSRRHFADDIFKCILLNENALTSIQISLKFIPKGPINNMPALVQIMAWCRPGDKPLSEPMIVSLPTHIRSASPSQTVLYHNPVLFPFIRSVCRSRSRTGKVYVMSCDFIQIPFLNVCIISIIL